MSRSINDSRIIIAAHYRVYSSPQALRDYLRQENCPELSYISHPLPIANEKVNEDSIIEISKGTKVFLKEKKKRFRENIVLGSILDIFLTIKWIFPQKKYNLFVGVDNLNALSGLILRMTGKVDKVVYYSIDYFPTRFNSRMLNGIYHALDKLCVRYSDETWNVSPMMVKAREKNGLAKKYSKKQFTVPIGVWFNKAQRADSKKKNEKKIIFSGHLVEHMGVDLILDSLPQIIKKIPKIHLDIIGGGEEEKKLKRIARELKIMKYVKFWGWVRERQKLEKIMSKGSVGAAPFNTDILDEKVKNADPAKLKDYMLFGLPIIVTDAISNVEKIRKSKSGIIIKYSSNDFAKAVIKLLDNKNLLLEYRKNAINYVKQFDYPLLFQKNINRVLNK